MELTASSVIFTHEMQQSTQQKQFSRWLYFKAGHNYHHRCRQAEHILLFLLCNNRPAGLTTVPAGPLGHWTFGEDIGQLKPDILDQPPQFRIRVYFVLSGDFTQMMKHCTVSEGNFPNPTGGVLRDFGEPGKKGTRGAVTRDNKPHHSNLPVILLS